MCFFRDVFYLYRISYLWFTTFGCLVTVTVACLLSLRHTTYHEDKRLFAPFVRRWVAQKQPVSCLIRTINVATKIKMVVCSQAEFGVDELDIIIQAFVYFSGNANRIEDF